MRPFRIVVPLPLLDHDLSFSQGIEYLPIQESVPEMGVEAFAITVFRRCAGLRSFPLQLHPE